MLCRDSVAVLSEAHETQKKEWGRPICLVATFPLTVPGTLRTNQMWAYPGPVKEGFVGNILYIGAPACKLQRSSPKLSVGYPDHDDLL